MSEPAPSAPVVECCPTCKRPLDLRVPRKICADCGRQIQRGHKYHFGTDGRVRHRVCARPNDYK